MIDKIETIHRYDECETEVSEVLQDCLRTICSKNDSKEPHYTELTPQSSVEDFLAHKEYMKQKAKSDERVISNAVKIGTAGLLLRTFLK